MMNLKDRDILEMKAKTFWPLHPILPVKNYQKRTPTGGPSLGVMYAHDEKAIVYLIRLDEVGVEQTLEPRSMTGGFQALEIKAKLDDSKKKFIRGRLDQVEKVEFPSVEEAVEAGWAVD